MFFENEMISFHILDVVALRQENVYMQNGGRNFSALSFRIHADTRLETATATYHLTDNCVAYVPARTDYKRSAARDEMIVIHFDAIDYYTKEIEFFKAERPEVLKDLFLEILQRWNKKDVGYKYKCAALLYEIIEECYRQNFHTKTENPKIKNAVAYLHAHYTDENLSVETLAKKAYMSEVYFRKLFKKEYGVSPQKYVIKLRMQHAVGLISTGYYSLKEVADLSGYRDYKYFSVEFKKAFGVSPSEYLYNYVEQT